MSRRNTLRHRFFLDSHAPSLVELDSDSKDCSGLDVRRGSRGARPSPRCTPRCPGKKTNRGSKMIDVLRRCAPEKAPNIHVTPETLSDCGRRERPSERLADPVVAGMVGVCFTLRGWYARIWDGRAWRGLGFYSDSGTAARVYDRAAREMYGPFVRQNFPIAPGIPASRDPEAEGRAADIARWCERRELLNAVAWALLLVMPHLLLGLAVFGGRA